MLTYTHTAYNQYPTTEGHMRQELENPISTRLTVEMQERFDDLVESSGLTPAWLLRRAVEMSIDDLEKKYGDN